MRLLNTLSKINKMRQQKASPIFKFKKSEKICDFCWNYADYIYTRRLQ